MKLKSMLSADAVFIVTIAQRTLAELTHINGIPVPPIQTAAQAHAETEKKIATIEAREAEETATRS